MDVIFVKIKVRPEKRKELSQTLLSIVEQVRKESGCLHAGYYRDAEDDNDFLVVEEWATEEDSHKHVRSNIFTVLMGAGGLMQRPPEIVVHSVSQSSGLEA